MVFAATALAVGSSFDLIVPKFQVFLDPEGAFANLNLDGPTDTTSNPFFQDLGSNGRRCVTCHEPGDAFSITPPHIRLRFEATHGTDPIFRTVDGANCPSEDVSTVEARRKAYSLLLDRGLIRIGIAVPSGADYQVMSVNNSYGCNQTDVVSMYRRPLPTTNLSFLSAVMFDGRESSPATGTTKIGYSNYPTSLTIWRTSPWMPPKATRKGMGRGPQPKNNSRSWISKRNCLPRSCSTTGQVY